MADDTSLELKDAVATELLDQIVNGRAVEVAEGEVARVSPPASILTAAIQFLKAFPPEHEPLHEGRQKSELLKKMADKMPFSGNSVH